MAKIAAWLDDRPDVREYKIGDIFDLWQDNYDDIED